MDSKTKIIQLAITEDEVNYISNMDIITAPDTSGEEQRKAYSRLCSITHKDPELLRRLSNKLIDAYTNG